MNIYIKAVKKAIINNKQTVNIGDIAEVVTSDSLEDDIKQIDIFDRPKNVRKKLFLVSVIDVVKVLRIKYPKSTIINFGEINTVIEFQDKNGKENILFKWLKVIFVTAILFTGCTTAIITFHTDSQLNEIFNNYQKIIFGQDLTNPLLMQLPYSVGVGVGIMVFFNHFSGRKITDDPTPIEVEMSSYESSVLDTVIEHLEIEEERR